MSLETILDEQLDLKVEVVKEHDLILFNDDVNTFDHVIEMLVKVCNHELLQAEQCAFLVHYTGKCAVKKGEFKELKVMSEILGDAGLTVEIN